jgi:site-specific recombinase XerD
MFGEKLTLKEKEQKKNIQAYENKAEEILENISLFSWEIFERRFLTNSAATGTLEIAYSEYISKLRREGRIGTAVSYEASLKSLSKFVPGAKLIDITPQFLHAYEKWALGKEISFTTIGFYLRCLRCIFNIAISEGTISNENYPFGKRKYEIPTGVNIKKTLSLEEIKAIYYYSPTPNSSEARAKDYWLFIYLCNGINVKDLCLLKYGNIKADVLEFERSKTARTKRKIEPIRVMLDEDAKSIIEKWGNKNTDKNSYVFPILTGKETPERERQLIQQATQIINTHMYNIAKNLKIDKDVTTYTARHSFATVLQRSGVSTERISEALGHTSMKTTQNYLAGFEDESKRDVVKRLLAFKNVTN